MQKREKAVVFKGEPRTLVGPQLKAGDKAPDFKCVTSGLTLVGLADTPAKPRLFSVVPSLDTPVCSQQTKKFDESLAGMKDKIACYTISLDLPFAQKRFCAAEGVRQHANVIRRSQSLLWRGLRRTHRGPSIAASVSGGFHPRQRWEREVRRICAGSVIAPGLRESDRCA